MNRVFLIGNLTRDPELTETASGAKVCNFSIAVNRNYSNIDGERQTDFFNCTAWRGLGETIAAYAKKGKKVSVVGSIQLRTYTDTNDIKRTAVDIIVQDVEFLSPRDSGDENAAKTDVPKRKPTLEQIYDDDGDCPF